MKTETFTVDDVLAEIKSKTNRKDLRKQVEMLTDELEKKNNLISVYEGYNNKPVSKIHFPKNKKAEEGTVLTLLSDIHIEHKITKENTSGINSQNPDTARQKVLSYFKNLLILTRNNRKDINLKNLLIGLLGDNIHGFIHEEYLRTNYMTPPEATIYVIDVLSEGFRYLLDNGDFETITAVCKIGNHSRITDKIYSDNEALLSYEWAIFQMLKRKFPEIEWIIDNSYFTYYKVYDKTIRFHHGHGFRYAGGIGGLYVPLQRYRLKVNQQRTADLDCIGHWHTADWLRNTKTLINGSVCGFDSYAMRKGFEPEPPIQQFLIIDSKRGFTINAPILLE
jgi:hypothetical protein